MSIGLLMIGVGCLLCLAAFVMTIVAITSSKSSKKKILDKMQKKY